MIHKSKFTALLLTCAILTGCSSNSETNSVPVVESETSVVTDITSSTADTTSSVQSEADSITEPAEETSSVPEQQETSSTEMDYSTPDSLLYSEETGTLLNIMDTVSFKLPVSVAKELRTIDEMSARVSQYISSSMYSEDLTSEVWHSAFQGGGYLASYPDIAMLMSETMITQIAVFPADDNTANYFKEFRDSEDGSILSVAFNDVPIGALYGCSGFDKLQPAGVIEDDDKLLLSYIFAASSPDFRLTDGYYGYFIIGYSAKQSEYFIMLIAGINGITDPALIQEAFNGVQSYDSKSTYWAEYHSLKVDKTE